MVAVTGTNPVFIAVNEGILPRPLAPRPIDGVLFTQLYTVPGTAPVKLMPDVDALLHTTWFAIMFTVGEGLTVMENVFGVPVQVLPPLVYDGVTVIVAVTGTVPALMAVNEPILPVPLAASPIDGVLFTQLYTVPGTNPLKLIAEVAVLLQTTWFEILLTVGVGLMVTVTYCGVVLHMNAPDGGPGYSYTLGTRLMVVVTGALVVFTAVNGPILPDDVLKKKNCTPLVVPTGPPEAEVIYAGFALQVYLTAELEKCTELINGVKVVPGQMVAEVRPSSTSNVKPIPETTSM